jgi:hypothetical protein
VKAYTLTGLALLALLTTLGAKSQDSYDTYLPGAIVQIAVQVEAPAQWALNPDVPLRITVPKGNEGIIIDEKNRVRDFKVKGHDATYTAELPIKISPMQQAGELVIPLSLACGICTTDQSSCTFVDQDVEVSLQIQGKGVAGSGGSVPVKKGRYLSKCALIPPEIQ